MYKVKISKLAEDDLVQIAHFIATDTGNQTIALKYYDKIADAIKSLDQHPLRGTNPHNKILRLLGYKYLKVETHLIFYTVEDNDKLVVVYRVLHEKTNYSHML